MKDLHEYLTRQRDWLAGMAGRKHANVALSLSDLSAILAVLEPRKLGPMEPRGTRRAPEEIRKLLSDAYNGGNPYNHGGETLAQLRAEA